MEIFDIENNTCKLGLVINAFKFITEILEEKIDDNFCILNNNEGISYYHELRSNVFLLNKILEEFETIKNIYQEQIEKYYKEN